jgi:hypothetical protein
MRQGPDFNRFLGLFSCQKSKNIYGQEPENIFPPGQEKTLRLQAKKVIFRTATLETSQKTRKKP